MTTKVTKAQEVAALLATHQHVERAFAIGNRVTVQFPRSRGGRSTMTLPAAKALAARLGLTTEGAAR